MVVFPGANSDSNTLYVIGGRKLGIEMLKTKFHLYLRRFQYRPDGVIYRQGSNILFF